MKRVIAALAAASMIVIPTAMPTFAVAAAPAGNSEVVNFCKGDVQNYPQETIGNCVALLTTYGIGSAGFTAQICSFFMKSRPDDFYAVYDSYNECILDAATNLP